MSPGTGPGRRRVLAALAAVLLGPLLPAARAQRPEAGFAAADADAALAALAGPAGARHSEALRIDLPALAEDGSSVALGVSWPPAGLPHGSGALRPRRVSLFGERNPVPLIASFNLAPGVGPALRTRIKLAESSRVLVLAETDAGGYFNSRRVEVARGGCLRQGAAAMQPEPPPAAGAADAIRVRAGRDGDRVRFALLARHPMMVARRDPQGAVLEPAHHVESLRVSLDERVLVHAHLGPGIARNPYLAFDFRTDAPAGLLRVHWRDNRGAEAEFEAPLPPTQ